MTRFARTLAFQAPPILGVLLAVFIGLFALDAVPHGIAPFLIHLAPAFIVVVIVALACRWERVGGATLIALSVVYAVRSWWHWTWILCISGPLVLVGVLFLLRASAIRRAV